MNQNIYAAVCATNNCTVLSGYREVSGRRIVVNMGLETGLTQGAHPPFFKDLGKMLLFM